MRIQACTEFWCNCPCRAIWTPGESFLIDLCTDAFRLSRGEAELYETIEKIQQGLERMVQQIFDAIHTLA